MARNYVFAPEEYYHLYARGVEKMPVYRDKADYQRFLEGMYIFNTSRSVNLKDIHRKITRSPTSARKAKMHLFDVDRRDT